MKNKVKLAVDLGNGFVKAKSANKELIAPSSMVLTSDVAISQSSLGNDYNTYKVNGAEFIWGVELENPAFIIESSDLISTYSRNSNRYNSKPFKDLFLAVLAELIYNDIDDDEGIDIELITGVPSDDLNDENIEAISNFLAGKHIVTRNRAEDITFKVGKVTVIEQPLGTLLDVAIADNLKINNDIMDQNNIILDFGAGTTSIDTFFKGKRVLSKSKTIYSGMKNIYTQILDNLENKELLNINDIEISLKNKSDIVTGHIEISYDQIKEEFDEISDTFMEYKILNVLENIFNDNQRIKIYLTGGGSNLLSGKLKSSVFKDSLIAVKDSQLSAVRGMYKYIMQKKK